MTEGREITQEFQELGLIQKPEDMLTINGEIGEICVIKATNKKVLVDAINAHIDAGFFGEHPDAPYLRISLSGEKLGCAGGVAEYKTEDDVPEHSVPCPCGNPKHWLIKYEE